MALASLSERTPISPAEAVKERSAPGQVTGKLRRALDAMVWQGLTRRAAAEHAGLSEHSLYAALRKPHVKAHLRAELDVLRENERARNIHALIEVRDQTGNQMARVQAVKALEQLSEEAQRSGGAGMVQAPGLTVVLNVGPGTQMAQPAPLIIDNVDGSST